MSKPALLKPRVRFIVTWVGLTALAVPLTWFLVTAILMVVSAQVGGTILVGGQTRVTEDYLMSYLFLPLLGLTSGALQYLLLKQFFSRMGWWIPASLAGWSLPIIVFQLIVSALIQIPESPASMLITAVLIGFLIAFPQWLVLRRRLAKAGWWLAAGAVGWGAAIGIVSLPIGSLFGIVAIILPPALSSGLVLYLLSTRLASASYPQAMNSA